MFLGELTSYLRKTIFILVQKKGIYAISRKNFLFTEKVNVLMIFCLFHCFHQTINKKHWILQQYTFFLKKIINDMFKFLRVLTAFYIKPPFTSITYAIWMINFSTFLRVLQYFYVKSIFPWKIKAKVSLSVIFFEFPCFN